MQSDHKNSLQHAPHHVIKSIQAPRARVPDTDTQFEALVRNRVTTVLMRTSASRRLVSTAKMSSDYSV